MVHEGVQLKKKERMVDKVQTRDGEDAMTSKVKLPQKVCLTQHLLLVSK